MPASSAPVAHQDVLGGVDLVARRAIGQPSHLQEAVLLIGRKHGPFSRHTQLEMPGHNRGWLMLAATR